MLNFIITILFIYRVHSQIVYEDGPYFIFNINNFTNNDYKNDYLTKLPTMEVETYTKDKALRSYSFPDLGINLYTDKTYESFFSNYTMKKNNKTLVSAVDYYFNYSTNNEYISASKPTSAFIDYKNSSYEQGCVVHLSDLENSKLSLYNGFANAAKFDTYNKFNFALVGDSLKYLTLSGDGSSIINQDFNLNRRVLNFWIFKNPMYPTLSVLANNHYLFLYNITTSVNYFDTIDLSDQLPTFYKIYKIDMTSHKLFVASNKGLVIFFLNSTLPTWNSTRTVKFDLIAPKVDDFVINDISIYILQKGKGIKIVDRATLELTNFTFNHPYINSLDKTIDDSTRLEFIGLYLNNTNYKEFLIELSIKDEFNPKINKVYMSGTPLSYNSYLTLNSITCLYDNSLKQLYMIKRNVNTKLPVVIFNLPLTGYLLPDHINYSIYPITLYGEEYIIFTSMMGKLTNNFMLGSFSMPMTIVKCFFKQTGNFNITLSYNDRYNLLDNDGNLANVIVRNDLLVNINDNLVYIWVIIAILGSCMLTLIILVLVSHSHRIDAMKKERMNYSKLEIGKQVPREVIISEMK
jgi:hypothetical protein